jgi:tRNA (guanine37-N1)-methyltransferase
MAYFDSGLQDRGRKKNLFSIHPIHLRDFSTDKHKKVDDTIYGGGPGMLLKIDPIFHALQSLGEDKGFVILTSPKGKKWDQNLAKSLFLQHSKFTFISGYYEGVDHRVTENLIDLEVSLGNFVITSGDLASLCMADSILRYIPGFLGDEQSLSEDSFHDGDFLEYPQYTKPRDFQGWKVPEVLLNGNHSEIQKWRDSQKIYPSGSYEFSD